MQQDNETKGSGKQPSRKQTKQKELAHLWHFESMDRINRALQGTSDLEQVMKDVLDTLLSVFECDRAWLVYPCDPDSPTWQVPMERTRPEYPGVLPIGVELPLDPVGAAVYRVLRNSDGPVKFGAREEHPVPMGMATAFHVQSFIAMAFYPKVGQPWSFGLHQCSYARVWTLEEERLFQEVGRRLSDALSSLLAFRNLQESEKQIKKLIDASPVAMIVSTGPDERVEWVNDKFIELFGYTPEDIPDVEHWWPLAYPDEIYREEMKRQWSADVERAIQEQSQIKPIEATVQCKNGSFRYVEFRFSSIGEKHLVTFVDLTEHKLAAEKLLSSEQLFRALVENSPDFIARYDREFRRIYVNPAIQKLFGIPAENVLGKTPSEQSPVYAPQIYIDHLRYVIDMAAESAVEMPYRTPEGEMHWGHMRFVPEFGPDGKVDSVLAIGRDIHEIKESEWRFRTLAENFPDLIVRLDHDYRLTYVNPAIEKTFGMPAHFFIGKVLQQLPLYQTPEKSDALFAMVRRAFDEGIATDSESSFDTQLGERIFEIHHVPEKDATGNVVTVLSIAHDITERKGAEQALRESERRLVAAQHMAHVGYWERDFDAHRVTLSAEACRIFGISEQGLSLSLDQWHPRWVALIHPEDQPRLIQLLGDALAGIRSYDVEYRIIRPEGEVRYIYSQAEIKRDVSGQPHNMLGMMQDITERRRAEEALRASENRFRVLSENAFVGIYIIQDEQLSYVNSTLAKIFGYTPEELTGAKPALVIHPDDQAMVSENIRRRIVGEVETVHYEFRGRCKDGETKNIDVLGGRINFGGKTAIIGNLMDITDRKRAEEEIARSLAAEKKARRVAEILREANESLSRTLDIDEVLRNLLQYLIHLVPYDSANVMLREGNYELRVVALSGYEFWIAHDTTQHLVFDIRTIPSLNTLVTTQKSLIIANTYEYPGWSRVPGTEHVVSWLGVPIIANGQVIGLYSVDKAEPDFFTDEHRQLAEGLAAQASVAIQNTRLHDQITQANVELEQRVASRTVQLEEANKELEAFAFSVSHDLRAPLRHIDGFIDLLQKWTGATIDEKSRHYMDVIADSAREMGVLIDDLLSFSRMGRSEMFKSDVDLNELVQDVIHESRSDIGDRDIQWKISALPLVNGDRALLRIVLVNLITNALKFTRTRKVAHIEIGCEEKGNDETVIFIHDNGVGFDMNYIDKLFGVFQRLHRQEDFEGTGIGLANVRRIISRHGGRTWADGKLNTGATFYFSLPKIHALGNKETLTKT